MLTFRSLLKASVSLILVTGPLIAHAQEGTTTTAAAAGPQASDAGTEGEDIVVNGTYARSLAAGIETKRRAAYGVDSISSTDIGKFPTQNVAEALQLVPGVAITRPRGEGLYVSVRGLGPQFQNTLMNGRTIALNDLIENGGAAGRQFRFEMLPAEFTSSIDVVKTPTADMSEGALGGNIDVKTFRPLEVGNKTTVNMRGTYTTQTKDVRPNVTVLTSAKNSDGTFGILAGAQYWGKTVRNDRFMNFGWLLNRYTSAATGGIPSGLYSPTRTRPTVETEDRKRISGIVSAQWQPTPELQTTLDVVATRLDVAYDEFGLDIYPDDGGTAGGPPAQIQPGYTVVGDTITKATINNVRFMGTREYSLNRHDLLTIGLKQAWNPDRWHVTANVNWSAAHSYHPDYRTGTVRSRAYFVAPLTYDASGGYQTMPTFTTPVDVTNPANYKLFQFNIAPKDSKDWDFYSRLDVAHDFDGFLSKLAVGGEYHWRKRDYFRRDYLIDTATNQPLTNLGAGAYQQLPYDDFLKGVGGNGFRNWLVPVTQAYVGDFFTPAIQAQPINNADRRSSFVVSEKIAAAYLRADYQFDAGSVPVTGNLGVRYVHTDQVASGTLTSGNTATPVSYPKTFNNVLPSFNLRADLSQKLVGRLAASRVLTRPNVTDTAPRITVSTDAPTASGGNPQLVPFLATQFDGSLEWYFAPSGMLSGAVFYKAMDDYITQSNTEITIPGRGIVRLSSSVNGGNAKVYGAEAAYSQVFTFLPKPFDGFGVQGSYTHTEVKADYMAGSRSIKDQLIGLSKNSFNLVGFYDKGPLSARLSYVWRDKYLSSTGSTVQAPTYVAAFGSLDGQLSVRAAENLTLSLEGINIAGARQNTYNDSNLRFGEINYYGRTILFGVRAEF
ncbi:MULTISPECIES: TonB-dependent receptor [Sphingomonas]|jgi:iron complex outermembrane recepter protein|uniref:TonB-dependent receptor n=1 Tax=Sphingomonas TaxID=13687 RepID=UPI0015844A79|nr:MULTISPECIES: TonB-dependent receptor [Sphingomonas]MBB4048767.1 TonB-dependent receptor [Sphingomonas zeae]MDK8186086.1 TonB-dependent receptor [Sphingomonas zeae]MDK8215394.1 TonB-dependent receptor [Sphingomonas sp. UMB7805-LC452B]